MIFHSCIICQLDLIPGPTLYNASKTFQYWDCSQCPYKFYISFLKDIDCPSFFLNSLSIQIGQFQINALSNLSHIYIKKSIGHLPKHIVTIPKSFFDWNWFNLNLLEKDIKLILTFS